MVLPIDAVIIQLHSIVEYSDEVKTLVVMLNQSLQIVLIGMCWSLAENPLKLYSWSVRN